MIRNVIPAQVPRTLLDLAAVRPAPSMQGYSLAPALERNGKALLQRPAVMSGLNYLEARGRREWRGWVEPRGLQAYMAYKPTMVDLDVTPVSLLQMEVPGTTHHGEVRWA